MKQSGNQTQFGVVVVGILVLVLSVLFQVRGQVIIPPQTVPSPSPSPSPTPSPTPSPSPSPSPSPGPSPSPIGTPIQAAVSTVSCSDIGAIAGFPMQGVDMRQNRAEGNAFLYNQGGGGCPANGAVVTGVEAATTSNDTFVGRVYIAPFNPTTLQLIENPTFLTELRFGLSGEQDVRQTLNTTTVLPVQTQSISNVTQFIVRPNQTYMLYVSGQQAGRGSLGVIGVVNATTITVQSGRGRYALVTSGEALANVSTTDIWVEAPGYLALRPLMTERRCPADVVCPANATCNPETVQCECISGFQLSGSVCSPVCISPACGANQVCVAPNQCACVQGFSGANCSVPVCDPACGANSTCTAPNTCSCREGFTGPNCAIPVCNPACSANQRCVAPNLCLCNDGFTGLNCAFPVCSEKCTGRRSVCIAPNQCGCVEGWSTNATSSSGKGNIEGANFDNIEGGGGKVRQQTMNQDVDCDVPVCANGCPANSRCVSPNACGCLDGWAGFNCQIPLCNNGCGARQVCSSPNTCSCVPGWSNQQQQPIVNASVGSGGVQAGGQGGGVSVGSGGVQAGGQGGGVSVGSGGVQIGSTQQRQANNSGDNNECSFPVCLQACPTGEVCAAPGECAPPSSIQMAQSQFQQQVVASGSTSIGMITVSPASVMMMSIGVAVFVNVFAVI